MHPLHNTLLVYFYHLLKLSWVPFAINLVEVSQAPKPSLRQSLLFCLHKLVFYGHFIQIQSDNMNEAFWVWFLSLSIMFLKFIHVDAYIRILLHLLLNSTYLYEYSTFYLSIRKADGLWIVLAWHYLEWCCSEHLCSYISVDVALMFLCVDFWE